MRNYMFFALILLSSLAKSQGYVSPEVGMTSKKTMQASLQAGYEFRDVVAEGDVRFICNRRDPAYFGLRGGYEIVIGRYSVTPLMGCYYKLQSTDKKALNGYVPGYGIRISLPCEVTLQVNRIDKTLFFGIGIKPNFLNND